MWNCLSIHWVTLPYRLHDKGLSSCVSPVCEGEAVHHIYNTSNVCGHVLSPQLVIPLHTSPAAARVFSGSATQSSCPCLACSSSSWKEKGALQCGALAMQMWWDSIALQSWEHLPVTHRAPQDDTTTKKPKKPHAGQRFNMNASSYSHKGWKNMEADLVTRFIQSS